MGEAIAPLPGYATVPAYSLTINNITLSVRVWCYAIPVCNGLGLTTIVPVPI